MKKIYNEIIIDMNTGETIYEDSFMYSGDIALCCGAAFSGAAANEAFEKGEGGGILAGEVGFVGMQDASAEELQDFGSTITEGLNVMGQTAQATANPMPSMPQISNVGAAPFSGSINWNAIPGGFQPLPPISGNKKKLFQLSKFHGGINQKSSPRDIADFECQEAENITVSNVGRIKILGDLKTEQSTGLTATTLASSGQPNAGYGWYIFQSGYSLAGVPDVGNFTINITQDGDDAQLVDNSSFTDATCDTGSNTTVAHDDDNGKITLGMKVSGSGIPAGAYVSAVGSDTSFTLSAAATSTLTNTTLTFSQAPITLDISTSQDHVAPVYYASSNGIYAVDANFAHSSTSKAAILVYRKDFDSAPPDNAANLITNTWVTGEALIASPTFNASDTDGAVSIEKDDIAAGLNISFAATTVAGSAKVHIGTDGDLAGQWDGVYSFFISWLFDNGCETGMTALGDHTCANEKLFFNFSVKDNNAERNYMGGDARIEGARVYFKKSTDTERWMLAEIKLPDGVRGALDTTFTPWDENATDAFDLATDMSFETPPELYSYVANNGYYANEMYDKSPDGESSGTAGVSSHDVRYKAATVGQNGSIFIGNVKFRGKIFTDRMMFSMPNKPALFPEYNVFDSPSSDGSPITALVSFKDTILQFKETGLYVINISNPAAFYTQASFRNCGVHNPCQVFQAPFGVIFANKHGCFMYDGAKVIALSDGKLSESDWGLTASSTINDDAATTPSVGYDPRSQSIIVLKNIGHDASSNDEEAWVYNMTTQSWTEGSSFIDNAAGDVTSNFQISPNGYLSMIHYDASDPPEDPYTFNIGEAASNTQDITYVTKDIDFGSPSQTKKIFKVYITYTSGSNVPALDEMLFGVDGATPATEFSSGTFQTSQTNGVTTFVPTAAATGCKTFAIKISGATVDESFEINDISILYRARPIK